MRNAIKFGSIGAVLAVTDDAATRLGTLGVIGGALLALASLMF